MRGIKGTQVREYMREVYSEHVDRLTGECNTTTLAEDAAQHFDWYEGDDVPEPFFEWAYAVDMMRQRIRDGSLPSFLGGIVSAYDHKCGRG